MTFLQKRKYKNVTVGLGGPVDYLDLNDAITAAAASSYEEPWAIHIGAGVFLADEFVVPDWCLIMGEGYAATTIQIRTDNAGSGHFITGGPGAVITNLEIIGPSNTDAKKAAVYYEMTQPIIDRNEEGNVFTVDNVNIGGGYYGCWVHTDAVAFPTYRARMRVNLAHRLDHGNSIQSLMRATGRGHFHGAHVDAGGPNVAVGFDFSGPCDVQLLACVHEGDASSVGLLAASGAQIFMNAMMFLGGLTAIEIADDTGGTMLAGGANMVGKDKYTTDLWIKGVNNNCKVKLIGGLERSRITDESTVAYPNHILSTLVMGDTALLLSGPVYHTSGEDNWQQIELSDVVRDQMALGVDEGGVIVVKDPPSDPVDPFEVTIEAGYGFLARDLGGDHPVVMQVAWDAVDVSVDPNVVWYFFVDHTGTVQHDTALPSFTEKIYLGRVVTLGTEIDIIELAPHPTRHVSTYHEMFLREVVGPVASSGMVLTVDAARKPSLTDGVYWYGGTRHVQDASPEFEFDFHYHVAGQWTEDVGTAVLPNTHYDNLTALQALTAGYYVKHLLYLNSTNSGLPGHKKFIVICGQEQFATEQAAIDGELPVSAHTDGGFVQLYSIITKQGDATYSKVINEKKQFSAPSSATGGGGITAHDDLTGRNVNTNHPQYLLKAGDTMAGTLNMNGNAITNATVNAVNPASHGSRHAPGGLDAISTAAAVDIATASAEGDSTSLARANHTHKVPNGLITHAMHADIPTGTFTGRNTALAGVPEDLNAVTATSMLNAVVGDAGAGGTKGLVPAPAAGDAAANKFLKADGTFATLPVDLAASSEAFAANTVNVTSLTMAARPTTPVTLTPAAGTYMVIASANLTPAAVNGAFVEIQLRVAGALVTHTLRKGGNGSGAQGQSVPHALTTHGKFTVNGSQAIELWMRTSTGTAVCIESSLDLVQVAP